LIGAPQVPEAYVRFRLDLLAAQRDARRALAGAPLVPEAPALPPPPRTSPDVPFPAHVLRTLLHAIAAAAAAHGRATEEVERLVSAAADDSGLLRRLAAAAAFGPDLEAVEAMARQHGIYADALLFVGRALAAPCVAEAVAARSGAPPSPEAGAHRCPACGSSPSVARLRRPDGRRVLTCSLCGSEWEAARLLCTCCGTHEREDLGMLRLADGDARWVETCEACKGYIKTVDERRLPEGETVLPVVEEAATLHLDLLAEREGYIRRVPYALSG
jgi:formate dehydrogenase accessory protein FdhE